MKLYTFYAKANPAFIKSLRNELSFIGVNNIHDLSKDKLNYLKFQTSLPIAWKIMLYSRLIEQLKIQINEGFVVRNEKELKMQLKKLNFNEFLPMNKSNEYKLPEVKAYSFRSNLYHEHMIENILKTTINKLAYDQNDPDNKLKINVESLENKKEIIDKLNKRFNLKDLPRLDIILQNDKARLLMNMSIKPLYMHGYKKSQNWGGLRETYASAIIYNSIIKKLGSNNVYLWDPFCGAGTILIEAFLLTFLRPIKSIVDLSKEAFTYLPFHDSVKYKKFYTEERQISKQFVHNISNFECKFIASDISSKSIDSLIQNCKQADLYKYVIKSDNEVLNKDEDINTMINPNVFHEKINNCFSALIGDFENIANQVIFHNDYSFKKFIIMTNIPYGLSHQLSDKIQIKHLYIRFGKFLRKYSHLLEDVYILVNKRDFKDQLCFKKLSEVNWEVINTFNNNGVEVEFLKMQKSINSLNKNKEIS